MKKHIVSFVLTVAIFAATTSTSEAFWPFKKKAKTIPVQQSTPATNSSSVAYVTNCAPWSIPNGPTVFRYSVLETKQVINVSAGGFSAGKSTVTEVTNWFVSDTQKAWATTTDSQFWASQQKPESYRPAPLPEVQRPTRQVCMPVVYADYYAPYNYGYPYVSYLGDGWIRFSYPNYTSLTLYGGLDVHSGLSYGSYQYGNLGYGNLRYGQTRYSSYGSYGSLGYGSLGYTTVRYSGGRKGGGKHH